MINNYSGDFVESGNYHVYRGLLTSTGESLHKIYNDSCDMLEQINPTAFSHDYMMEQKAVVDKNIKAVV